jgi:hypothetical protein
LAGVETDSGYINLYSEAAICAAWQLGKDAKPHSRIKAARDRLARSRLTPAELAALARAMRDFNRKRHDVAEGEKPCEWLRTGSGCTERTGTVRDAHSVAWDVLSAAMSILVEVPIERIEDETALLELLLYTGWRMPKYQRKRVAKRMACHVDRLITRTV